LSIEWLQYPKWHPLFWTVPKEGFTSHSLVQEVIATIETLTAKLEELDWDGRSIAALERLFSKAGVSTILCLKMFATVY
jgi:hypothetical protein